MRITKKELEDVAKAFCKKIEATFIYANEYEIGYETKYGALTHKDWNTIADLLSKLKEEEK